MNKRKIGDEYEKIAAAYLENNGYIILEKNYRCRNAEIDIIAKNDSYICFVEVKYRKTDNCGGAAEAVDHRKRHKITMAALYYMQKNNYREWTPCRFDVLKAYSYIKMHLKRACGKGIKDGYKRF